MIVDSILSKNQLLNSVGQLMRPLKAMTGVRIQKWKVNRALGTTLDLSYK